MAEAWPEVEPDFHVVEPVGDVFDAVEDDLKKELDDYIDPEQWKKFEETLEDVLMDHRKDAMIITMNLLEDRGKENARLATQLAECQAKLAEREDRGKENARLATQLAECQAKLAEREAEHARLATQLAEREAAITTAVAVLR
jgi:septal ring factor EnvC (AmiA/AmiB activator)